MKTNIAHYITVARLDFAFFRNILHLYRGGKTSVAVQAFARSLRKS